MSSKNLSTLLAEAESAKTLQKLGYELKSGEFTGYDEYFKHMKQECLKRLDQMKRHGGYSTDQLKGFEDRMARLF